MQQTAKEPVRAHLTFWKAVDQYGLFPLTPALSLGERENRRQLVRRIGAPGFIERRNALLPLPEGEGWGEGEAIARSQCAFRT